MFPYDIISRNLFGNVRRNLSSSISKRWIWMRQVVLGVKKHYEAFIEIRRFVILKLYS